MDEVELAELTDTELIRIRPFVAAHRVGGVGRTDSIEECFTGKAIVRVLVFERHAPLVAPIDVDLPPVDLGSGVVGKALVALACRAAAGERDREPVAWSRMEAFDDALGELRGDVVDDDELSEHWGEN